MDIYLDQAATSHPKPPEVLRAVQEAMTVFNGNPGRSGHRRALSGARVLLNARSATASLINASQAESVVFCFNCTDALNAAIKGSLCIGDHVITSALEHNSVLRVLEELRLKGLIEVTIIDPEENGMISPGKFLSAVRSNTALCILTHASNVTGAIQPVAAVGQIMHEQGIRYLIDGAQAIGHVPVNVRALCCDMYAFPGHKGLLAPQGTGGLYIHPNIALRSFREGGTGSSSDSMIQPSERPECFESGTLNLPGIAGLLAGINLVSDHLTDHRSREQELTAALWEGLNAMPDITLYTPREAAGRVGVVSFNVGKDLTSAEAADRLDALNISVRGGLHCAPAAHRWMGTLQRGAVRASLSWQNTFDDIEALLRAIHTFTRI